MLQYHIGCGSVTILQTMHSAIGGGATSVKEATVSEVKGSVAIKAAAATAAAVMVAGSTEAGVRGVAAKAVMMMTMGSTVAAETAPESEQSWASSTSSILAASGERETLGLVEKRKQPRVKTEDDIFTVRMNAGFVVFHPPCELDHFILLE